MSTPVSGARRLSEESVASDIDTVTLWTGLYYDQLPWMMFLEEKSHMEFADNLILDLP